MNISICQIAKLEWTNYAATQPMVQVTPGVNLFLRDEVIIISNENLPDVDTTHACLLRTTLEAADSLITEIVGYFRSKNLPTTIFISPACTPTDLGLRLVRRGFVRRNEEEAWLVLDDLPNRTAPPISPIISVKQVNQAEALTFANTFMTAFELPLEFASLTAQTLAPSMTLPGVYHYLACFEGHPIGTCSLICYKNYGLLGSVGVIPAYRGSRTVSNLVIHAVGDALRQGVDTLVLQTTAGARLERLLRIYGFKEIFSRIGYTLPS